MSLQSTHAAPADVPDVRQPSPLRIAPWVCLVLVASLLATPALAQPTPEQVPPAESSAPAEAAAPTLGPDISTQAVAAYAVERELQLTGPFNNAIEHLVDGVLTLFDVPTDENTLVHYAISAGFLVLAFLLRKSLLGFVFRSLRRLFARTPWSFDDRLLTALEPPVSTGIMLVGIFAGVSVLNLPIEVSRVLGYASTVAFSIVIFWAVLRALGALLDQAEQIANRRQLGITKFMPWIKKSLLTLVFIFGALMVIQNLGYDVKAILAGLGIGGLAFALAAQDTLANVFGAVVVAVDQPFKHGDFVKIGAFEGFAEEIGLRSTRLRHPTGNLIIVPNKVVAAEGITNNSRFIRRRVDQVIGLTYDTSAEKMDKIVQEIRAIIAAEPDVIPESILVFFRDYNASSLDIWTAFNIRNPDFIQAMQLRQRVNLAIMRAVEANGLSFAFPTRTIHFDGEIARQFAQRSNPPESDEGERPQS